jgi:hypothetical protein
MRPVDQGFHQVRRLGPDAFPAPADQRMELERQLRIVVDAPETRGFPEVEWLNDQLQPRPAPQRRTRGQQPSHHGERAAAADQPHLAGPPCLAARTQRPAVAPMAVPGKARERLPFLGPVVKLYRLV